MGTPNENPERMSLPAGRISNTDALAALETAIGIARATLLEKIPELGMTNLAFGLQWASDGFSDSEVGRHNASLLKGYALVKIPILNVEGDQRNDMKGINRFHAIDVDTFEIQSKADFSEGYDQFISGVEGIRTYTS